MELKDLSILETATEDDSAVSTITNKSRNITFKNIFETISFSNLKTTAKNIVGSINEMYANINKYALNGRLITGSQLTGNTAGVYNERTIAGLSAFAEVRVFVAIGDCVVQWLIFDSEQTEQTLTGYYSQQYSATVVFKCDLSTGTIGVKVVRTIGWTAAQHRIIKLVAISKK